MRSCKPFLFIQVSSRLLVFTAVKVVEAAGCQYYLGGVERGMKIGKVPSPQNSPFFPRFNCFS